MNRFFAFAFATMLSALLISTAGAGQNGKAGAEQDQLNKAGNAGQTTVKKSGYSVEKEYKKRVEAKKKAMELRKRMIQQSR